MYSALLEIHSILRYAIFVLLLALIIKSLMGWVNRSDFLKSDNVLSLVTLSAIHLQVIAGLILYFISPLVGFGKGVMQNDVMRYYTVEHILMMVVAVALFTMARVRQKRKDNPVHKHRTGFLYNMAGLLVVVLTLAIGTRGII